MKKILTLTAIFAMLALPLFAAKTADTTTTEITSVSKSFSTAQYPDLLVPASLQGMSNFVADINLLPNTVMLDVIKTRPIGIVSLKTDMGTFAMSLNPLVDATVLKSTLMNVTDLNNIDPNIPVNVLGAYYGTKIASMNMAFGVRYGIAKNTYDTLDNGSNPNPYHNDNANSYLSLNTGAALDGGIDLGASVNFVNQYAKHSEYYNNGHNWNLDNITDKHQWELTLNGRMNLGSSFSSAASIVYTDGTNDLHHLDNATDYTNRWTNSSLNLQAVVGKDIKAIEGLNVKIAGGLNIGANMHGTYTRIDNLTNSHQNGYLYGTNAADRTQHGYWNIPLNVAVEVKLNETWTLNAGTTANIVGFDNTTKKYNLAQYGEEKIVEVDDTSTFTVKPGLTYALGFTGKIGDLKIDTYLNPAILITGPYFLSGVSAGSMNTGITFRYEWK